MIKLSRFLEDKLITFDLKGETKEDIISELVDLAANAEMVKNK